MPSTAYAGRPQEEGSLSIYYEPSCLESEDIESAKNEGVGKAHTRLHFAQPKTPCGYGVHRRYMYLCHRQRDKAQVFGKWSGVVNTQKLTYEKNPPSIRSPLKSLYTSPSPSTLPPCTVLTTHDSRNRQQENREQARIYIHL